MFFLKHQNLYVRVERCSRTNKTPYAVQLIWIVDINTESQCLFIIINDIYKTLKQPKYHTMLGHSSATRFIILYRTHRFFFYFKTTITCLKKSYHILVKSSNNDIQTIKTNWTARLLWSSSMLNQHTCK